MFTKMGRTDNLKTTAIRSVEAYRVEVLEGTVEPILTHRLHFSFSICQMQLSK